MQLVAPDVLANKGVLTECVSKFGQQGFVSFVKKVF